VTESRGGFKVGTGKNWSGRQFGQKEGGNIIGIQLKGEESNEKAWVEAS